MLNIVKDDKIIVNLIREYRQNKSIEFRNKLIEDCYYSLMFQACHLYKKYKFFDISEYKDMMIDTFLEVIEKYRDDKNAKFLTYFNIRARGNILDNMRKKLGRGKIKKIPLSLDKLYSSKNNHFSILDFITDKRINIEENLIIKEEVDIIKKIYKDVYNKIKNENYKKIFIEYYYNGLHLTEIDKKIGVATNYSSVAIWNIKKRYFPSSIEKYFKKS